jgi:4-amino-4-deoxy-L-arabinose transferase-like glycosyltransferase
MGMPKANKRKRSKQTTAKSQPPLDSASDPSIRISRQELVAVGLLLLLGVGLRLAFPSRMAVEHFDEGVYASNIWFGTEFGFQYPQRRLYAPPLLPSLIEWSLIIDNARSPSSIRPSSLAAMAPSLFAGCLTLVAVWWTARDWFGSSVGLSAMALASLSDLHTLYSRTALTEAPLVLFLILSLWATRRALAANNFQSVVLAGLFTGLAWWTKYNGWLPLAIGIAGIGLAFASEKAPRARLVRPVASWAGITCLAFVFWCPYLWKLQPFGGYAAVAENHRQYVVGFGGWLSSLQQQYANLNHYDGWLSSAGIAVAAFVLATSIGRAPAESLLRRQPAKCLALALGLAAAATWLGSAVVMFVLALLCVGVGLRQMRREETTEQPQSRFALYLSAAWIVGLFAATPLYHPYPRLTLPWVCGLWLVGAAGLNELLKSNYFQDPNASPRGNRLAIGVIVAGLASVAIAVAAERFPVRPLAWQSRAQWESISEQIVSQVETRATRIRNDPSQAIVFVYGEPALFFHLNAVGSQAFIPAGNLEFVETADPSIPTFLVAGPHADRTPDFVEEVSHRDENMSLVAKYDYRPSDLVLLNQLHPRELSGEGEITQSVRLYMVGADR